ncbi:MAG: DUF2892 domain-containing protein [Paracoccaceae bacterium]
MFKKNVGNIDRIIRAVIGVALVVGFFMNPGGSYSWLYIVVAVIALGTAAMSSCPLYSILGLNTCQRKV